MDIHAKGSQEVDMPVYCDIGHDKCRAGICDTDPIMEGPWLTDYTALRGYLRYASAAIEWLITDARW
jgi:hypothetical protein